MGFLYGIIDEDKNYNFVENPLKTVLIGIVSGFGSLFISEILPKKILSPSILILYLLSRGYKYLTYENQNINQSVNQNINQSVNQNINKQAILEILEQTPVNMQFTLLELPLCKDM